MEDMWKAEPPAVRFMRRLVKQRAELLMRDKVYLKTIRCNYPVAKRLQKRFGDVWSEFGTNIFELIAGSCGEDWDAEDEEKFAFAQQSEKKTSPMNLKENTRDDDVVATCEKGARSGLDQLQGKPETGLGELEEAEEGLQKGRDEGFYRRAGGSSGP
jgi:hypothetical protein